ncbi:alpha-ketoacid dehydrogenase subunit beta [Conexibacter woesei]|uniref:Transketolase central region n=1 Tax=Conexibacter woesei (strain DSM 14684 / CCUG 47730 / CIP 108061 / JCM 11494 / NBRC 100937 / ID131577) TaxID=469383 RepID=D3F7R8_CONWI|nr:alpha-ketoacid dehydrogenase subunit beta [Conexibacter woesei]ADB52812.1 Transketolase central region [Conexibacter woesei DSM 14684]
MSELNLVEAVRLTLAQELARDERVVVLGQDVGRLGGVFRATDGLHERFGDERVVDTPLAEAVIVGSAIGLAISGMVPVAEIQFMGFLHQAFHQLGPQLGRMRYRSGGRLETPVTIRAPFGGGIRTPEHHADALEAQLANCPGLKIVMPADPYEAKGLLTQAIRDPDPVLFCEPLRGYRRMRMEVPEEEYTLPFGRARTVREGGDVTLVAWSSGVAVAEEAADLLAKDGVESLVLDLRTLVPLDEDALREAVAATGRCVVVSEGPFTAGFASEVAATAQQEAFWTLEAPVARVTGHDTPYPLAGLEERYIPTPVRVAAAARALLGA